MVTYSEPFRPTRQVGALYLLFPLPHTAHDIMVDFSVFSGEMCQAKSP